MPQSDPIAILSRPLQPYLFIRGDIFYLIDLHGDEDARNNAECNPGTVRVENMLGQQVWPAVDDASTAKAET